MTLTEFLLARITEDEARLQVSYRGAFVPDGDDEWATHRVTAECEAKRQAIEAVQDERRALERNEGAIPNLPLALRALALPYDDHPDYQQEWKP